MPELRYYVVTQEREIKISATDSQNAAILANRVFSSTMRPEDQLNVQKRPRETSLNIREDKNAFN